jgi:predicted RNase H-like HicB family nuclease
MATDYTVVLEKADDGSYSVYVPDLPGCISTGDTVDEALRMIREAIQGHLQLLREQGEPIPEPRSTARVVPAA